MPCEKTLLRPPEFYRERNIETRLETRVVSVEPEKRTLEIQGGERLEFDSVLIATGGRIRGFAVYRLPLPRAGNRPRGADAAPRPGPDSRAGGPRPVGLGVL